MEHKTAVKNAKFVSHLWNLSYLQIILFSRGRNIFAALRQRTYMCKAKIIHIHLNRKHSYGKTSGSLSRKPRHLQESSMDIQSKEVFMIVPIDVQSWKQL